MRKQTTRATGSSGRLAVRPHLAEDHAQEQTERAGRNKQPRRGRPMRSGPQTEHPAAHVKRGVSNSRDDNRQHRPRRHKQGRG